MGSIRAVPREPWQEWLGLLGAELGEIKKTSRALAGGLPGTAYPPQIAAWLLEQGLIGDKPQVLEDLSYGFPPTKGSGLATKVDPKAMELADFLPWGTLAKGGKAIAAALKAVGAKTGLAGAAVGALRAGGPRDLIPSHGTSVEGVMRSGDRLISELYSPSIAVQKGELANPFEGGLTLIPRLGVADPRYSTSTLFNRDAFIARKRDYKGYHRAYDSVARDKGEVASGRLWDRFEANPGPRTESTAWHEWEGAAKPTALGHDAALFSSPAFPSFRRFEQSPAGAGVLGTGGNPLSHTEEWEDAVERLLGENNFLMPGHSTTWYEARQLLLMLSVAGGPQAKTARELLQSAKQIPSEYAELKFHGPLPLTKDYWAGAIYRPERLPEASMTQAFFDAMERRGIMTIRGSSSKRDLLSREENMARADILQRLAGPIKWGDINRADAVVEPVSAVERALVTEAKPEQISLFGPRVLADAPAEKINVPDGPILNGKFLNSHTESPELSQKIQQQYEVGKANFWIDEILYDLDPETGKLEFWSHHAGAWVPFGQAPFGTSAKKAPAVLGLVFPDIPQ